MDDNENYVLFLYLQQLNGFFLQIFANVFTLFHSYQAWVWGNLVMEEGVSPHYHWIPLPLPGMQVLAGFRVRGWMFFLIRLETIIA